VYCRSSGFTSFPVAGKKFRCYDLSSLSEKKAMKLAKTDFFQFIMHTSKFLIRSYPDGLRFDSSNYDPQVCWVVA
jgi:hypothetical protein